MTMIIMLILNVFIKNESLPKYWKALLIFSLILYPSLSLQNNCDNHDRNNMNQIFTHNVNQRLAIVFSNPNKL